MNLSNDQSKALKLLQTWYSQKEKNFITLGGFAGTGKTTLISLFRHELYEKKKSTKVAFCAFTGKATRVLVQKLTEQGSIYPKDSVSTIHSLIYSAVTNGNGEVIGWSKKDALNFDLIIADEASMIDRDIWQDLLSYGIPIIAVGDHGQLPPIHGNFNLMEKPQIILHEIHRQAKENPIIELSIIARETGQVLHGDFGNGVKKLKRGDPDSQEEISNVILRNSAETLVLCGYNHTRIKLNKYIRSGLGFEGDKPQFKDRVICLKNNRKKEIYNGMTGRINMIEENEDAYYTKIIMDDSEESYSGLISAEQFNSLKTIESDGGKKREIDLFDFGYAITVHKSQGSQARQVILFEERFKQMDELAWRRWLYTGITRAEEKLLIIG